MTVTMLDSKTALIIVDLQKGIVTLPSVRPIGEVIQNASVLADAFRRHRLPVVLVNVVGGTPGRTEQARSLGEFPAGSESNRPHARRTSLGSTSRNPDAHSNSITRIFPPLGETGTTRAIMDLLEKTRG